MSTRTTQPTITGQGFVFELRVNVFRRFPRECVVEYGKVADLERGHPPQKALSSSLTFFCLLLGLALAENFSHAFDLCT